MNSIKEARLMAGLSQKQVAIPLGVSTPTVSEWETGKKAPSTQNLKKLSELLHVTTDFLLNCEPNSPSETMFRFRIRELRENNGYPSQQAFANVFGVPQFTVANWEAGKREPNYQTTIRLADFFCVSVDYLLGHSDAREDNVITTVPRSDELTKAELELLFAYRKASDDDKAIIDNIVKRYLPATTSRREWVV